MSLEKIVRPFQTGDVFTARVLAPVQPAVAPDTDVATLSWQGSANATWVEEPSPITLGFTVEWNEDKNQRVTETIRVTNPNDSSQFVDLERIKKATFVNNLSGEQMPLNFNWGT